MIAETPLTLSLADVMSAGKDGLALVDQTGVVRQANARFGELVGEAASLVGRTAEEVLPGVLTSAQCLEWSYPLANDVPSFQRALVQRTDGSERALLLSVMPVSVEADRLLLLRVMDDSQQHAAMVELSKTPGRAEAELADRLQYQALTVLLQHLRSRHELRFVLGLHLERLLPHTRGALFLIDTETSGFVTAVRWGGAPDLEDAPLPACVAQHLDTTAPPAALLTTRIPPPTHSEQGICAPIIADGAILGVLFAERAGLGDVRSGDTALSEQVRRRLFDVADRLTLPLTVVHLRERLQQTRHVDALTGLPDRTQLDRVLAHTFRDAATEDAGVALAVVGLDQFSMLNRSAGFDAGDHLLRSFARFLQGHLQPREALVRLGGDEFVIVFPGMDAEGARARIEVVHARWLYETAVGTGGHTFSTGVADATTHGAAARDLLRAAARGLADAKAAGGARTVVAGPPVPSVVPKTSYLKELGVVRGSDSHR
ncbi:MAG: diguanylate cyclase [Acidobacteria bacterium]|nr:diguanylate cyclase [Acidobacteriota bacterium]